GFPLALQFLARRVEHGHDLDKSRADRCVTGDRRNPRLELMAVELPVDEPMQSAVGSVSDVRPTDDELTGRSLLQNNADCAAVGAGNVSEPRTRHAHSTVSSPMCRRMCRGRREMAPRRPLMLCPAP